MTIDPIRDVVASFKNETHVLRLFELKLATIVMRLRGIQFLMTDYDTNDSKTIGVSSRLVADCSDVVRVSEKVGRKAGQ
jgi:hypothetical protein